METLCSQCKQPFDVAVTGRPRKFCSPRCRLVAHRQKMRATRGGFVPVELAGRDRFVRHSGKRPITPAGRVARVNDPGTWASLDDVLASSVGDGVGFVLGEGIGCIDLDNCIRSDGSLSNGAQFILDSLDEGTWVEVSPSGRGLHIWGKLPERRGRVTKVWDQPVEVYSVGRYVTVTGERWGKAPLVLADLEGLVSKLL